MSDSKPLQFDRVEPTTNASSVCSLCKKQIVQSYYEANGQLICGDCRETISEGAASSRAVRFGRAFVAGLGVAILGAVLWWGVRKLTGYEIGIISIAIGVGVGRAVRWGSHNRGGWAYQLLAILLTYAAVAGNYMPDVFEELSKTEEKQTAAATTTAPAAENSKTVATTPAAASKESISAGGFLLALVIVFFIAAASPIVSGANNIIGILIIAFGLYEAWKINRRVDLTITGPFSAAPIAPPPPANE
jgi:hypothetical protein